MHYGAVRVPRADVRRLADKRQRATKTPSLPHQRTNRIQCQQFSVVFLLYSAFFSYKKSDRATSREKIDQLISAKTLNEAAFHIVPRPSVCSSSPSKSWVQAVRPDTVGADGNSSFLDDRSPLSPDGTTIQTTHPFCLLLLMLRPPLQST